MKQEQFEIIENNLKKRISQCEEKMDHILTTDDLTNITIKEFLELQSFCKQEQIDMTEILMVDLYHVLGMGKLTMTQRNIFLSLIHKYATYRSDMKCICSMKEISDLPKLPSKSRFKLHKLGDVTLESDPRGPGRDVVVLDETNEVSDYKDAKKSDKINISNLETYSFKSIIITDDTVTMNITNAKEFIKAMANDASVDVLFDRCSKKQNYCDIRWEWADDDHTQLKGTFLSSGGRGNAIKRLKERE